MTDASPTNDIPSPASAAAATAASNDNWDLVMAPPSGFMSLNLKDIWRYRDLVVLFVRRDFVAAYKQTILGPLWHLIQPLLTTLMFTVVFGRIAGLPTDGVPQFLFYMAGTTVWTYFANCLTSTSSTFISNASIFKKVYFPRLAVPVATVISRLIAFAIQFTMFLAFYGVIWWRSGRAFGPNAIVLLLPLLLLMMAGLGLGFGVIISSMTTKYRDLQVLFTFIVQLWMYATPIVYPLSQTKSMQWMGIPVHKLMCLNPVTPVIETFKYGFLGCGDFVGWRWLIYSFVFMTLLLIAGIVVFNKVQKSFMDTV